MLKAFTFIFFSLFFCTLLLAQKIDTVRSGGSAKRPAETKKRNNKIFSKADTSMPYSPRVATIRSAILPGWGQATNKKYWKIPIVYAALGTTAYIFFRNVNQYKEAKNAYANAIDGNPSNDIEIPQPYYTVKDQPERIRTFRNQVRQNVDYTVLFFIAFWGLNVVDATVDAHLKTFDVSDDLSLQIRPGYSELSNTNGISIVLKIR